ncbi:hypothetical protein FB567DRAFT_515231 [Paraphoma chrysanthemicola]|uniref:Uncharacterized protein n=1 Tax=Paraphoma chrysanthemicola TaxID=798071 RepID=A0A8K0RI46_9PLEO|nr:hypothetical protein FB567DRAFT_515231 [Paraphoma chrysanthemicola]
MIWERDYSSDHDRDLPEPAMEPDEGENAAPVVAKKAATKKRKKKATLSFTSRKKKTGSAKSKSAASTKDVAGEVNDSWKRRRANIDYPYCKAEFCREKVPILNSLNELEQGPTDWAEETTGRREWHAYQLLSPCSSVDSPPRTPIRENIIEEENPESIPRISDGTESDSNGTWRVVPDGSMPDLEPNRRRCETDKCRAWWMHPREECLIVHSERTQKCSTVGCRIWREHSRDKCADMTPEAHEEARRRSGTDPALMYNDEPRILPESGVSVYVDRMHDHYGIRQPKSQEARWPKLGIRVPYAPMTFNDRKLDRHRRPSDPNLGDDIADPSNGGCIAKDARKRVVHCMRSLDVPIIKRAQEDWGRVDDDPPAGSGRNSPGGSDDDAESDDEGDLFRASYMEGSGPATAGLDPGNSIDLTEEPPET